MICKNRIPSEGFHQREEVGFLNLETTAPLIGLLSPPQGGTQKHHLTCSPSGPWVCFFLGGTGASSCNLGYRRLQSSSTKSAKSAAISTPVGPPHWEHHHQRVGIQNRGLLPKNGAPQKLLLGHVVDPPCWGSWRWSYGLILRLAKHWDLRCGNGKMKDEPCHMLASDTT